MDNKQLPALSAVCEWIVLSVFLYASTQLIFDGLSGFHQEVHDYELGDVVTGVACIGICGWAMYGLASRDKGPGR